MKRTSLALLALLVFESCGSARVSVTPNQPKQATAQSALALLHDDLTALFAAPQFERSFWSVVLRPADADVDADQAMFALNPGKLMMPGSNMKSCRVSSS